MTPDDLFERTRRVVHDRYEGSGWNEVRKKAEAEILKAYEDGRASAMTTTPELPSVERGEMKMDNCPPSASGEASSGKQGSTSQQAAMEERRP